jgi:hypothetical protein
MSAPSFDKERPWPPLITEGALSGWVYARDALLTALLWFLFVLLMVGDIERVVAPWLDRFGIPLNVRGIGYADLAGNWRYFLHALAPFLAIVLFLVIVLASFTIDTLSRRRKALRGPRPPKLALGVEARHAELATIAGHKGSETEACRAELEQIDRVDARSMLVILAKLDQAALTDARSLRVTQVHVTGDGHFQIRPDGMEPNGLARQGPVDEPGSMTVGR